MGHKTGSRYLRVEIQTKPKQAPLALVGAHKLSLAGDSVAYRLKQLILGKSALEVR